MPLSAVTLGQRVRSAREAAGYTQAELGALLGLGASASAQQSAISRIEKSGQLSSLELADVAEVTRKPLDYFLTPDFAAEGVALRLGSADPPAVHLAVDVLNRFVDDYEFLISLGD